MQFEAPQRFENICTGFKSFQIKFGKDNISVAILFSAKHLRPVKEIKRQRHPTPSACDGRAAVVGAPSRSTSRHGADGETTDQRHRVR